MIKQLLRNEVRGLRPVNWGEYDNNSIRLFWGENLIELPENVIDKVNSKLKLINRYPDPNQSELKEIISKYNNVKPKNVTVGNGSDALIELIAKTFISKGDQVLIPIPSFITYSNVTQLMGGKPAYVKLDSNFNLNLPNLIKKINLKTKAIFIANPNNPTGNYLIDRKGVNKILNNFRGILVIDECYFELGGLTVCDLIKRYKNLIILRSFSKGLALAGLRVGYALSSEDITQYLSKVQKIPQPFEVNILAQIAAIECIKERKSIVKNFFSNKKMFISKLKTIKKVGVIDTKTSFILLDLTKTKKTAKKVKSELEKYKIFTKDCSLFSNLNRYYLYMGIPEKKDFDYVIKAIWEIIK